MPESDVSERGRNLLESKNFRDDIVDDDFSSVDRRRRFLYDATKIRRPVDLRNKYRPWM